MVIQSLEAIAWIIFAAAKLSRPYITPEESAKSADQLLICFKDRFQLIQPGTWIRK